MLNLSYYQNPDTLAIARNLIGKRIVTTLPERTSGIIVEVEAYLGTTDKACHAYEGRRTPRTEIMYAAGGVAYIYLCYGMHLLFNIVTHTKDQPHAILIRAIEPIEGIPLMLARRNLPKVSKRVAYGPGNVTQALGLTLAYNGHSLTSRELWIEEGIKIDIAQIESSPRIGIDYAQEDALKPWRFTARCFNLSELSCPM